MIVFAHDDSFTRAFNLVCPQEHYLFLAQPPLRFSVSRCCPKEGSTTLTLTLHFSIVMQMHDTSRYCGQKPPLHNHDSHDDVLTHFLLCTCGLWRYAVCWGMLQG